MISSELWQSSFQLRAFGAEPFQWRIYGAADLVESLAGEAAPGRVLRYTFCGAHERGEVVESPHLGAAGFVRVLRPTDSATSEWFTERVDLAADYREAFGEEPPDPVQIAIQADTDDTHSASRAMVADLVFAPRRG